MSEVASRIQSVMAGVPWLWWVGRDSATGVADSIVEYGARKVGEVPVMAISLERIPDVEGPPDLEIEIVEGRASLQEWVETYTQSFGIGCELVGGALNIEAERSDSSRIVRFIARREGKAVGTALMFDTYDVAGIYVVSTKEAERRQGIGAKLTVSALKAGQERGLRVGTLQASGLGVSVYARMGFERVAEYELFQSPS
jgi:predicted GNAT family acetyltransferase